MAELYPTPLTVVGSGPAGIMAAYTAAMAGVDVTIIDENPLPGGQYYRQSPLEFNISDSTAAASGHPEAPELYAKLDHPRIRTLNNMKVWGVFDGRMLALADSERTYLLPTDRIVLATGAYDRPLAFPGWTLPGVQGAGATLRMVKTQWVLPGKRILLSGLGPVQLALADLLLKLGLKVICVAEAANPLAGWRYMPAFWGHWDRLREAFGYVQTLRRHNVPLLYNHAIIAATGVEQVESATIARLDAKGSPIPGTERTFEVDTVCLGYGFLPSYQLPVAFGCELQYDKNLCWHVPHHNSNMETTQPGVFVAGDVTDISGANVALAEGKIAGLAAAYQLGYMDEIQYNHNMAVAQAELTHFNRVAHAIQSIYAFRPGLAYLASDDTMLCRCEEVTCRKVKDAIREGAVDINQVKLFSRAGMGYCQGRMCSALVASWIFHETGQSPNELQPFTVRSPIQPILLKLLAADIIAG